MGVLAATLGAYTQKAPLCVPTKAAPEELALAVVDVAVVVMSTVVVVVTTRVVDDVVVAKAVCVVVTGEVTVVGIVTV